MIRRPPRSTRCPYTTLFRSTPSRRKSASVSRSVLPSKLCSAILRSSAIVCSSARGRQTSRVESHGGRSRLPRSEEHTSELQSRQYLVCRLLLEQQSLLSFIL